MVKQFLANLVAAALKTSACDFFGKIPKNPTMKTSDAPCETDFLCMPFEIHESDFLKKPEGGSKNQQEKTTNLDEQRLKMVSSAYSGKNTFLFPNFFKNCTPPKTPTWWFTHRDGLGNKEDQIGSFLFITFAQPKFWELVTGAPPSRLTKNRQTIFNNLMIKIAANPDDGKLQQIPSWRVSIGLNSRNR